MRTGGRLSISNTCQYGPNGAAAVRRSPSMNTVTMGFIGFSNMHFIEYNLMTAAAMAQHLPTLIIFLTLQK